MAEDLTDYLADNEVRVGCTICGWRTNRLRLTRDHPGLAFGCIRRAGSCEPAARGAGFTWGEPGGISLRRQHDRLNGQGHLRNGALSRHSVGTQLQVCRCAFGRWQECQQFNFQLLRALPHAQAGWARCRFGGGCRQGCYGFWERSRCRHGPRSPFINNWSSWGQDEGGGLEVGLWRSGELEESGQIASPEDGGIALNSSFLLFMIGRFHIGLVQVARPLNTAARYRYLKSFWFILTTPLLYFCSRSHYCGTSWLMTRLLTIRLYPWKRVAAMILVSKLKITVSCYRNQKQI